MRNPIARAARRLRPQVVQDRRRRADDEAAKEKVVELSHDEKLKAFLEKNGYYNVRILPDGIVCTFDFIFTRAVIINPNWTGYEKRYCYEKRELAVKMCDEMQSVDDPPLPGYTAIK